jgi:endonuclease/exonuclease/phosphatase family metal-dependent hydrolase
MQNGHTSSYKGWGTASVSIILWFYAGALLFVWFFARLTPEDAAILRILASFLSNLVWIPFGIVIWASAVKWLVLSKAANILKVTVLIKSIIAVSAAVLFVIFFPNTAFRFLFLPLAFFSLSTMKHLINRLNLFSVTPIFIIIVVTTGYYGWQMVPSFGSQGEETDIKIMTYNILGNAGTLNRLKAIETIRREQPDVVCCTEYNPRSDPAIFAQKLTDLYPYSASNRDKNSWRTGELILSRYPITFKRSSEFDFIDFVIAEVNAEGKKINIVNVHLTRAGPDIEDVNGFSPAAGKKIFNLSVFERAKDEKKFRQAKFLNDYMEQLRDPTIICGDFNDTPNSRVYNLFAKHYNNAYSMKGWGTGDTFGESSIKEVMRNLPVQSVIARDFIRIDHIFTSRHFDVVSSRIVNDAAGSDHKPVIAVVRLNK